MPPRLNGKPYLTVRDGRVIGKEPDAMSYRELQAAGHTAEPMGVAVVKMCRQCAGGDDRKVYECTANECPLWPFRQGSNPWPAAIRRHGKECVEEHWQQLARPRRTKRPPSSS